LKRKTADTPIYRKLVDAVLRNGLHHDLSAGRCIDYVESMGQVIE
jgi:hypothetical protein